MPSADSVGFEGLGSGHSMGRGLLLVAGFVVVVVVVVVIVVVVVVVAGLVAFGSGAAR